MYNGITHYVMMHVTCTRKIAALSQRSAKEYYYASNEAMKHVPVLREVESRRFSAEYHAICYTVIRLLQSDWLCHDVGRGHDILFRVTRPFFISPSTFSLFSVFAVGRPRETRNEAIPAPDFILRKERSWREDKADSISLQKVFELV